MILRGWDLPPDYYNHDGSLPSYLLGCAATDDYTGFPRIIMYFGGDEIFAAEASHLRKVRYKIERLYAIIGMSL